MNKKRVILLLLIVTLALPEVTRAKGKGIKFDLEWRISTRVPLDFPFEASIGEDRMLHLHFMSDGIFALNIKDLNGRDVYTVTVSAVSGQDIFIDLKQIPSGTYLLTLKNDRLEAAGYLWL